MARNQSAVEPVGTPPEGGRWTWDGAQWLRMSEEPETTPPAANELQPANEE